MKTQGFLRPKENSTAKAGHLAEKAAGGKKWAPSSLLPATSLAPERLNNVNPPITESQQCREVLPTRAEFLHPQKKLPRKQYAFYLQEHSKNHIEEFAEIKSGKILLEEVSAKAPGTTFRSKPPLKRD